MFSHNPPKKISLLLGQDLGYCRRALSGILSYAEQERLNWIFHDAPPELRVIPALRAWQPDGIIAHLFDRALTEALIGLDIPLVSTTHTLEGFEINCVDVDNEAVGEMAARYLITRGFKSFAYYGSRYAHFSRSREQGFRREIESHGYPIRKYHAEFLPRSPLCCNWKRSDHSTERWLAKLPKPVGILASNDIPARMLSEICRKNKWRVPQEIAILGVDNDTSECRMSTPPLSSIETPAEIIGHQAAARLQALLTSRERQQQPLQIRLPPRYVIERESTSLAVGLQTDVAKAVAYIEAHCHVSLSVNQVSRAIGISRRSLERKFNNHLGISVQTQIHTASLSIAKHLLLQTKLPIAEIAERSGLSNARKMHRIFKKHLVSSPTQYRKYR
jgi:LacI family transcriptional regulator